MTFKFRWFSYIAVVLAVLGSGLSWAADPVPADPARPVLHVAYFIPTDRTPEPDRVARLDRVMTEVQRFYRDGMKQNGFGPMTFELDRDAKGALKVYDVRGQEPMRSYGRDDSEKVRREVKAALAKEGLNLDFETIVIFELLLEWQGDKATEIGPYVGGGNAHGGTAWVFDDAKLDPALLASKEPGGCYGGPCSIGQFNTHYIGGVAHELGHALGLPHDCQRNSERPSKGNSLMGSGNHTYGQELRGEGPGTFLSAASALPLSVHPLFTGKRKMPARVTCEMFDLTAVPDKGKLTLTGRLQGGPKIVGVVAYNDAQDIGDDYDATGWTSPVDADGRFRFVIEDLRPVGYDLRLGAISESGDRRTFAYRYTVDSDNRPDVGPLLESGRMQKAVEAYRAKDKKRLAEIAAEAKAQTPVPAGFVRKVEQLLKLLSPSELHSATDLPAEITAVKVADLTMETMEVGYGNPLRNQVRPEEEGGILLEVGGVFFESGLYAHAPARYAVRVNRGWKTLNTKFGLQDGHDGSVIFVVKGDGKELFRSQRIGDHKVRNRSIPIAEVDLLELIVENAGDGANGDWGVWLDPELRR
jgi:hypothetical protein